ncbi:Ig-like domain-containing protein [bacterium]|nr:Ig-like domain-containing protein [bacterium]
MRTLFQCSVALTAIAAMLITMGCSDDDSVSSENNTTASITRVFPADGAVGLSTLTTVGIVFSGPVDSMSFMDNFHLTGGSGMHEWRDSLEHSGGWGMMGMNQQMHMMDWMDSIHTMGSFQWNGSKDSCEFTPAGPLDPNSDYLCVLNETGMRDHNGEMMGGMGQNDDGLHMFGFSTGAGSPGAPRLISTYPTDGSVGVDPAASLTIVFDIPMDTISVVNNFHMIGGDDMHMWMDSLDHHMGMGGMGMMGMDHMMDWMDSIQYHWEYHWNDDMDTCLFIPDSALMPNTDYMMFLSGDVHGHNGEMMNMQQMQYDGHMVHFTTGP